MSSSSSPKKTYTLAGSPEWQKTQRCKPIKEFSPYEREFIKDALTSEWDQDFTGTRVIYIEPEGSDVMSMFSNDDEAERDTNNNSNDALKRHQQNGLRKEKFKKMAKRLYPAKAVGGAKVVGGAFRHPMVTGRKVNQLVRRKVATGSSRDAGRPRTARAALTSASTDNLPPVKRSATMTEGHASVREGTTGESLSDVTKFVSQTSTTGNTSQTKFGTIPFNSRQGYHYRCAS